MSSTTYHSVNNRQQIYTANMTAISKALYAAIAILMLSAAIEMALLSNMVYWLHYRAGKAFEVTYNDSSFSLHGKPLGLLANQGHTSNAAGGTAFILVGLTGILALWLRGRGRGKGLYYFWLVMTVVSVLLSLSALVYTMVLTNEHAGQNIDVSFASTLHNEPYPNYVAYPAQLWTPENWFAAVLQLDLTRESDRHDIEMHLECMKGWRWNLIPLFVLGLAVCALAFADTMARRTEARDRRALEGYGREGKRLSA